MTIEAHAGVGTAVDPRRYHDSVADAADAATFRLVRGKDYFNRIVRNVKAFTEMQAREGLALPRVSLWLTGLKETIAQLGDFVRIAHDAGVREVYLQRLVFFDEGAVG